MPDRRVVSPPRFLGLHLAAWLLACWLLAPCAGADDELAAELQALAMLRQNDVIDETWPLTQLTHINLCDTPVSDHAAPVLLRFPRLESAWLDETLMTERAQQALDARLGARPRPRAPPLDEP